jgi:hypothetical protein
MMTAKTTNEAAGPLRTVIRWEGWKRRRVFGRIKEREAAVCKWRVQKNDERGRKRERPLSGMGRRIKRKWLFEIETPGQGVEKGIRASTRWKF